MSSDNLVRNSTSPIQMNSGSAVSVHDDAVPQIVTAIASPTGRLVNNSMPIQATPSNASFDPDAHAEQHEQKNDERGGDEEIHVRLYSRPLFDAGRLGIGRGLGEFLSAQQQNQVIGQRDEQHAAPAAMQICGIHKGVASLPCEMSWKVYDCHTRRRLNQASAPDRKKPATWQTISRPCRALAPACCRISVTRMCSPRFSVCASARKLAPAMQ